MSVLRLQINHSFSLHSLGFQWDFVARTEAVKGGDERERERSPATLPLNIVALLLVLRYKNPRNHQLQRLLSLVKLTSTVFFPVTRKNFH